MDTGGGLQVRSDLTMFLPNDVESLRNVSVYTLYVHIPRKTFPPVALGSELFSLIWIFCPGSCFNWSSLSVLPISMLICRKMLICFTILHTEMKRWAGEKGHLFWENGYIVTDSARLDAVEAPALSAGGADLACQITSANLDVSIWSESYIYKYTYIHNRVYFSIFWQYIHLPT